MLLFVGGHHLQQQERLFASGCLVLKEAEKKGAGGEYMGSAKACSASSLLPDGLDEHVLQRVPELGLHGDGHRDPAGHGQGAVEPAGDHREPGRCQGHHVHLPPRGNSSSDDDGVEVMLNVLRCQLTY